MTRPLLDEPTPCHHDHTLGYRVTRDHTDDCPGGNDCPAAGHGCQPCPETHCAICNREHLTPATPLTCPGCQLLIDDDLATITRTHHLLPTEAVEAGADGHLAAAAPIPGGTAQILAGPTIPIDQLRVTRHTSHDHHRQDPVPPLAILAWWEDTWRVHYDARIPATYADPRHPDHPIRRRATVDAAVGYLRRMLPVIVQDTTGPDVLAFTRQIRRVRAQLEYALHDERVPELGVDCFECGARLIRRFHDRPGKPCRHTTPARRDLKRRLDALPAAQAWVATLRSYGLTPTTGEYAATKLPSPALVAEARRPCTGCDQGGLEDPTAGRGWECPQCRKQYDPGEYAHAVRRGLLDQGPDGDGWTHLSMAAEAAQTLTGVAIPASTIRKWMDRGRVRSCCLVQYQRDEAARLRVRRWGVRLVFWPDVADQALDYLTRMRAAEARRRERAACEAAHGGDCWTRGQCAVVAGGRQRAAS